MGFVLSFINCIVLFKLKELPVYFISCLNVNHACKLLHLNFPFDPSCRIVCLKYYLIHKAIWNSPWNFIKISDLFFDYGVGILKRYLIANNQGFHKVIKYRVKNRFMNYPFQFIVLLV
jgi:hypothetical protein